MSPYFRFLVALPVVLLIIACQKTAPPEKGPLEGVWKSVEVSVTAPDTSWTNTSPQPSLYIFAKPHYSIMFVPGTQPRALFAVDFQPTDAEKLAAYNSFVANSGSYGLTDSTITTRPLIAKNPNLMAGQSLSFVYWVKDDSLWLKLKSPPWAPESEIHTTLVRLE